MSNPEPTRDTKNLIDLKDMAIAENAEDESSSSRSRAGAEAAGPMAMRPLPKQKGARSAATLTSGQPRVADSSFLHQFAPSNSYTSLDHLRQLLEAKVREYTVNGKLMLNKGMTVASLAAEVVQERVASQRYSIPKIEEFIKTVTADELQALCMEKESKNRT